MVMMELVLLSCYSEAAKPWSLRRCYDYYRERICCSAAAAVVVVVVDAFVVGCDDVRDFDVPFLVHCVWQKGSALTHRHQ